MLSAQVLQSQHPDAALLLAELLGVLQSPAHSGGLGGAGDMMDEEDVVQPEEGERLDQLRRERLPQATADPGASFAAQRREALRVSPNAETDNELTPMFRTAYSANSLSGDK